MKKSKAKDRHHRIPTSKGGKDIPSNISTVPVAMHRAYHQLFSNLSPKEVARVLTDIWIDPAYYLVAIPRARSKRRVVKTDKGEYIQITFFIERIIK